MTWRGPFRAAIGRTAGPPFLLYNRAMFRSALLAIGAFVLAAPALAQPPVASRHADPPPAELADPIEALMAPGGPRVTIGAKTIDFWFVKSLPLRSGTAEVTWSSVDEGTLVGAAKLSAAHVEIRGKTLKPGIYTLRFALQPQNGDHLGASPYREFLLLGPVAADSSQAALGHDAAVDLSKQAIGTSHPAAWSIDPPQASAAPGTLVKNDLGLTSVIVEIPVSRDGKDAETMRFGVVVQGTIVP